MHYCLVTYGSRGDVQPFIYLALGLKDKGYRVTLAAPGNFKQLVESYDIDFYPLHGDAEELVMSPEFRKVISAGSNIGFTRMVLKKMRDKQIPILDDVYKACETADAIIAVNTCIFYAAAVAEKFGKKWLLIQLNPPMIPTKAFPMLMFNFPDIKWLNAYTYSILNNTLWWMQKKDNGMLRQRLGLPSLNGSLFKQVVNDKVPMIHAFSPELIAKPYDWDEQFTIAGFFSQPKQTEETLPDNLPDGLEEWLQAGEKPLYIGFGSIPFPDTDKLSGLIKGILNISSTRIIYCRGWSEFPDMPLNPNLFVIEKADHGWLLPKCRASVIHGGIGTIAAMLQAGIPVIVASLFVDQPAWGKIIAQKKLGVHIPWRKLTASSILNALRQVGESPIAETIKAVNTRLMKEDGVATAVQTIEKYCS
jgi:sterol 3beta-glucosyltransferase